MRESLNLIVPEAHDAVRGRRRMLMRVPGMLQGLARVLGSGQVILAPVLFRDTMRVSGTVVQFGSALVVLVRRSVVLTCRHKLKSHDLPGLRVGFLGQLVRLIGVLQSALGMPVSRGVVPFFIVLRGGAVGFRREFVHFRRLSMLLVHNYLLKQLLGWPSVLHRSAFRPLFQANLRCRSTALPARDPRSPGRRCSRKPTGRRRGASG